MNKASPKVRVPGLARTAVSTAESAPSASDFVNFWTDYQRAGSIVTPDRLTKSLIPYWQQYEKGRASFAVVNNEDPLTGLTVTLFGMSPDETIRVIGKTTSDDEFLEPIEFDISAGEVYAVRVTGISAEGETPTIDVDVHVDMQGFFAYRH